MDAKAKAKAAYRAKMAAAQKREKRIESPLVRYNEHDQPFCKVCNIPLKSESQWLAHQASRKHHEAIESFRASASGQTRANNINVSPPAELHKARSSSAVPADFFDKQDKKSPRSDMGSRYENQSVSSSIGSGLSDHPYEKDVSTSTDPFKVPKSVKRHGELSDSHVRDTMEQSDSKPPIKLREPANLMESAAKQVNGALPENFFDNKESDTFIQPNLIPRLDSSEVRQVMQAPAGIIMEEDRTGSTHSSELGQPPERHDDAKQGKGELPAGFFDNKDADLRARGIEPVKVDVNDAYKEFEKEIQDNLQEIDARLEEDEIDAADVMEEFESLEQREFREQVEMMKKRLTEVQAARSAKEQKPPVFMGKELTDKSSSGDDSDNDDDDDDDDGEFVVDWRAKHF